MLFRKWTQENTTPPPHQQGALSEPLLDGTLFSLSLRVRGVSCVLLGSTEAALIGNFAVAAVLFVAVKKTKHDIFSCGLAWRAPCGGRGARFIFDFSVVAVFLCLTKKRTCYF